jgi:hypothetical protein
MRIIHSFGKRVNAYFWFLLCLFCWVSSAHFGFWVQFPFWLLGPVPILVVGSSSHLSNVVHIQCKLLSFSSPSYWKWMTLSRRLRLKLTFPLTLTLKLSFSFSFDFAFSFVFDFTFFFDCLLIECGEMLLELHQLLDTFL